MKSFFFWKKFISILRSYTLSERILSVFLLLIFSFSFWKVLFYSSSSQSPDNYFEGLVGYVSTLNPLFVDGSDVDREISQLIFSGLTRYDPEKKAIVEDMATLKLDKTQTEYLFTLKDFLKWHDGEAVTADDIYFTFRQVIQSPKFTNPILKANFQGVVIEKIDGNSVKFTLNKSNSFFITNFTVGLLPYHIFKDVPVDELPFSSLNEKPIGTGPFRVVQPYRIGLDEEGEIFLTSFKDYYGGRPFLKNFVFRTYPTIDALLRNRHELNGIPRITGEDIEIFKEDDDFELQPYELLQYTAVFLNMDRPLLQQKRVRLALQKAISKEQILNFLPNRIAVDTPLLELNQQDWVYQYNLQQAQGALYDSGWRLSADGQNVRRNKNGDILKLRFIVREFAPHTRKYRETHQLVEFLRNSWQSIGIVIDVSFLPFEEFARSVQKRDYDLLLAGQNLGYNFDTYYFWHSTQASEDGLNLSNYKSFAVDALIEEIRQTFDEDRKNIALQKLAVFMKEDIPALFLFRDLYFYVSDRSVSQLFVKHLAFPADRFWNIVDWKKY